MTQHAISHAANLTPPGAGQAHAADAADAADSNFAELISFAIGDDQYGVDIMAVCEIKEWTSISPLPKQPEYVRGVVNLRGIIVPIVDLRCRFGQGITECTPTHIMIIVQFDGKQVGLLADRVLDIVSYDESDVRPVPKVAQSTEADFISGLVTVEENMIALVDLANLLSSSTLVDQKFDSLQ